MLTDVRSAWRTIVRNPGSSLLIVLTLVLGIGANTAVFSIVNAVLLHPLPYDSPDRIIVVQERDARGGISGNAPATFLDLRRQTRTFERLAAIRGDTFELTSTGEPAHLDGAHVTTDFFDVFGVAPLVGRTFKPGDDARGNARLAVLSYKAWQQQFGGDRTVVDRVVRLNGGAFKIAGVMPPGFEYPIDSAVWVLAQDGLPPSPIEVEGPLAEQRGVRYFDVVGRLRPHVTLDRARADATTVARAIATAHPKDSTGLDFQLRSLHDFTVGDVRFALLVLLGAVGLVLLVACANVANLLIARSAARQQEVAIRAALGASRWRLARLFLTESLLLALAGGALAVLAATWSLDAIRAFASEAVPLSDGIALDPRVALFSAAATLLAAAIFGLAPLASTRQSAAHEALKTAGTRTSGRSAPAAVRRGLVVAEVAIAVVLLAVAGLMGRSLWNLLAVDTGVRMSGVTTAMLPLPVSRYPTTTRQAEVYEQVLDRLRQHPRVSAASAAFPLLLSSKGTTATFDLEKRPAPTPASRPEALLSIISPGYFRSLGVPLLRGRDVTDHDTDTSTAVALVSREFVRRYLGEGDPIGERLLFAKRPVTIVGVVGDFRRDSIDEPPEPMLFIPYRQFGIPFLTLLVRSTAPEAALASLMRRAVREVDPGVALADIKTLEEVRAGATAQPRFRALLVALFGALALLLAWVGVFGVLSQSVSTRTRELGVRVAVGAQPGDVYRLLMGEAMRLAAVGIVIGVIVAMAASKAISTLLFGVTGADVPTFAAVLGTILAAAALASFLPARRAARIDPIEALRCE